jgi:hypothetical protein
MLEMGRACIIIFGLIAAGVALSGCESPALKERFARRERNLDYTFRILADMEERRDGNLDHTGRLLAGMHDRDVANSRENPDRLRRWIQADFDRWDRNLPGHEKRFDRLMAGDPANIERTLPIVID